MRAVVVFVMLVGSAVARADVPDPAEQACRDAKEGDACDGGVCTKTTCQRWRPGENGKGTVVKWECMKCMPKKPPAKKTDAEGVALDAAPDRTPLFVGLGVGMVALGGGVWFARRRGKRTA